MEENKTINIAKELEQSKQEPNEFKPSQDEILQLLSQTVIQQQEEINNLNKRLADAKDYIKQLKDELESLPKLSDAEEAESSKQRRYIMTYLDDELEYAKLKVKELKHHLVDYPEDSYSQTDLQNCLLHINYLNAMKRRLYLR